MGLRANWGGAKRLRPAAAPPLERPAPPGLAAVAGIVPHTPRCPHAALTLLQVSSNLSKQSALLASLAAAQATFRSAYGYSEWRRACEGAARGARSQAGRYRELQAHLSEGLRFYTSLQEAAAVLRQQAGDHVMTRRIER